MALKSSGNSRVFPKKLPGSRFGAAYWQIYRESGIARFRTLGIRSAADVRILYSRFCLAESRS